MADEEPIRARSRRDLLLASAGVAGGATAVLVGSCGGGGSSKGKSDTVSTTEMAGDAAVLNVLLDMEHSAIVAYADIVARLRGPAGAAARRFLAQERQHAAVLTSSVRGLGATPVAAKPPSEYRSGFPRLRSERDALAFALDVETTAVAAYADGLGKIATNPLRVTLAAILTTEAEHQGVVLGRLGRPQAPEAFVTGPPPKRESD